ncbi:hypothetical protein WJX72_011559 [[Myrmecia] bisecta]|uniref:uroporphyrinogen-III C-methyltransferase n=1 Tax=[Myrmecia] bisecta TaxID=41462 RepID=A0AAW1PHB7_9CHLO
MWRTVPLLQPQSWTRSVSPTAHSLLTGSEQGRSTRRAGPSARPIPPKQISSELRQPSGPNPVGASALRSFLSTPLRSEGRNGGPGEVFLVGTGPGDPGLLTLWAVRMMQTADVVLYDRLVSPDILRMVHSGARMIYVGKEKGFHTRTQDEIHALLYHFAEEGATVLRLKGGDPYVFGRGGEEVQYLEARGIHTHCIPGITAASGICAEFGIPLTHRGVATSVRFLTGHSQEERPVPDRGSYVAAGGRMDTV